LHLLGLFDKKINYLISYLQVVVFMRNQKLLVKVVLKIAMMNANIVMDIKMLIRKPYLNLVILREKECHRILVNFIVNQVYRVGYFNLSTLITPKRSKKKKKRKKKKERKNKNKNKNKKNKNKKRKESCILKRRKKLVILKAFFKIICKSNRIF